MKKAGVFLCLLVIMLTWSFQRVEVQSAVKENKSQELAVKGTEIVYKDNSQEALRLMGVSVAGLEWDRTGEADIKLRLRKAMNLWKANTIRIGVSSKFWNGNDKNAESYKKLVDELIEMVAQKGKHVILDLHSFRAPDEEAVLFWKDAAVRYKNNPAVLFGLFNEPHDITWEEWRNGGTITENGEEKTIYGMQELIEIVRDTGADNIVIVGGLDWGYDLAGILENGGLLKDQQTGGKALNQGNGIVYDTHIYPNKGGIASWEKKVKPMRAAAPVIAGEWGWDPNDTVVLGTLSPVIDPKEIEEQSEAFEAELLKWFDKEGDGYGSQMHWTAWVFHASATPSLITDNKICGPTSYHGFYVFNKLAEEAEKAKAAEKAKSTEEIGNSEKAVESTAPSDEVTAEKITDAPMASQIPPQTEEIKTGIQGNHWLILQLIIDGILIAVILWLIVKLRKKNKK